MKYPKVFKVGALGVLATLVLIVSVGASSASAATVMCSVNKTPCPSANILPSGTNVYGAISPENPESGSMSLTFNAGGKITCGYMLLGAVTTQKSGTPLAAKEESILGNCKIVGSSENCSSFAMSNLNSPNATISATGGGSGTMTFGNTPEFKFTCYDTVSKVLHTCLYVPAAFVMSLTLDAVTQRVTAKEVGMEVALHGEKCGFGSAKLNVDSLWWSGGWVSTT